MTVYVGCGAGARVACSAGYRHKRYACCDLHRDIGVAERVHRSMRQSRLIADLMYPIGYRAWILLLGRVFNLSFLIIDKCTSIWLISQEIGIKLFFKSPKALKTRYTIGIKPAYNLF